jgi:hypothetical protein
MKTTAKEVNVIVTTLSLLLAIGLLAGPAMGQAHSGIHLSVNGKTSSVILASGDEVRIFVRNETAFPTTAFTLVAPQDVDGNPVLEEAALLRMRDLGPGQTDVMSFVLPAGLPAASYVMQSVAIDINDVLQASAPIEVVIAP